MNHFPSLRLASIAVAALVLAACAGAPPTVGGVTAVTVSPAADQVAVGDTLTLVAAVQPATASQAVTWTSNDPTVATVDAAGVVTGVADGTAGIVATSQADPTRSATSTITVTEALACTTYTPLPLPQFTTDATTVPPGCYDLTGVVRVQAAVTIEANTEIRATDPAAGIRVEAGGVLRALGTSARPIRFTAAAEAPGSWTGLRFGTDADNLLRHATVEYAGNWTNAFHLGPYATGVRVETDARLELDGVTIRRSATDPDRFSAGLFLQRGATVTMSGANRFVENGGPGVHVTAPQIHLLDPGADYGAVPDANGINVVLVNDDATAAPPVVAETATWSALNVPYRLERAVTIEGASTVVTIAPGARFEALPDAGIRVLDGAGLRAVGGEAVGERIEFAGVDDTAGAWPGFFINTPNAANEFRHTLIAHAGQASLSFHPVPGRTIETAIRLGDGTNEGVGGGQPAALTFFDNEVRASAGSGILLEHSGTVVTPTAPELPDVNDFVGIAVPVDDLR